jgi:isoaspartyl peptidase/L-asparaginase-like protein (Ntn-hydrolase superfamily)
VCATPPLPDGACWSVAGSALDAVEEAVVVLEDDETFDAGRGSFLNRDGKVQLDAFIMDGATLRGGGVGCVERLRNPVRAARKILSDSPHVYFVAEGAERFAAEHGIALCRNEDLIIPREVERLREYQAQASTDGNDLFAPEISHAFARPLEPSPSTAMATSPLPLQPEARSTKLPAVSATPRSSAAAAMPIISAPPPPPPDGANPS